DLADAVVGEVEALAHAVQHAAAHEFLRPLGRLRLAEIDRALEEGKVEFPPDHRRHRHQGPGPLREPLESSRDDLTDPLGKGQGWIRRPRKASRRRLIASAQWTSSRTRSVGRRRAKWRIA